MSMALITALSEEDLRLLSAAECRGKIPGDAEYLNPLRLMVIAEQAGGILDVRLETVKNAWSCRAARAFPGRLARVRVSARSHPHKLLQRILTDGIVHDGCTWRYLHGRRGQLDGLFMLLTTGPGLPALAPEAVYAWHIPPGALTPYSMARFHARMDLAFSRSLALDAPVAVRYVEDVFNDAGVLMSDGCAPASMSLCAHAHAVMKAASASCADPMTVLLANLPAERTPVAFQARFGGYKGVWYADPRIAHAAGHALHLRPSQCKIRGLEDIGGTQHQRQFEVLACNGPSGAACTNMQQIVVLVDRGVKWGTLADRAASAARTLVEAARSPTKRNCMAALDLLSSCGATRFVRFALERPGVAAFVHAILKLEIDKALRAMADKLHVPIQKSRRLMMIPDPTGLLDDGEVFFQLSDADTVASRVLLIRNPCYMRTDLLVAKRVMLVDKAGGGVGAAHRVASLFQHVLWDVLVLPVRGRRSMASQLSGGDYDGDEAWVCWDEEMFAAVLAKDALCTVASSAAGGAHATQRGAVPFADRTNAGTPPAERACCKPVVVSSRIASATSAALAEVYLSSLRDTVLGQASNLHLAWADMLQENLHSSPGEPREYALDDLRCRQLADICSNAVDAWKGVAAEIPGHLRGAAIPHFLAPEGTAARHSCSPLAMLAAKVKKCSAEATGVVEALPASRYSDDVANSLASCDGGQDSADSMSEIAALVVHEFSLACAEHQCPVSWSNDSIIHALETARHGCQQWLDSCPLGDREAARKRIAREILRLADAAAAHQRKGQGTLLAGLPWMLFGDVLIDEPHYY